MNDVDQEVNGAVVPCRDKEDRWSKFGWREVEDDSGFGEEEDLRCIQKANWLHLGLKLGELTSLYYCTY